MWEKIVVGLVLLLKAPHANSTVRTLAFYPAVDLLLNLRCQSSRFGMRSRCRSTAMNGECACKGPNANPSKNPLFKGGASADGKFTTGHTIPKMNRARHGLKSNVNAPLNESSSAIRIWAKFQGQRTQALLHRTSWFPISRLRKKLMKGK